jgi:hypothetical protein
MSKFLRKVSDTEKLPSSVQQAFIGASSNQDDPYAHLRMASRDNQLSIAKQSMGYDEDDADIDDRSWERVQGASIYEDRRASNMTERMNNLSIEDFSPHAVRRSDYGIDAGESYRETTSSLQAYTPEDYMAAMLRGASIWDPDMEVIADAFHNSQETQSEQVIAEAKIRREARQNRHQQWEEETSSHLDSIRPSRVLSARAAPILRTAAENEAAGNFGMIDFDSLDNHEAQRLAMQEEKRNSRLALKRNGIKDRDERHNDWQDHVQTHASTIQDIYNYQKYNLSSED